MDKITEEFYKSDLLIDEDGCPYEGKYVSMEQMHILALNIYRAGHKSTNPEIETLKQAKINVW